MKWFKKMTNSSSNNPINPINPIRYILESKDPNLTLSTMVKLEVEDYYITKFPDVPAGDIAFAAMCGQIDFLCALATLEIADNSTTSGFRMLMGVVLVRPAKLTKPAKLT